MTSEEKLTLEKFLEVQNEQSEKEKAIAKSSAVENDLYETQAEGMNKESA